MRKITGMRWFSISRFTKLMKFSSASRRTRRRPSCFSSLEKYGEKKKVVSSRFESRASANWPSCSRSTSSLPCSRRPRTAPAHIPGPAPPSVPRGSRGERGEVEVDKRFLDEAALIGVGEHLFRDLLGRQHGQVGNLAADVRDRALGGDLDFALGALGGLRDQLLAVLLGLLVLGVGGLSRALDDLIGLRPCLLQPLAVLRQQLIGLLAGALR